MSTEPPAERSSSFTDLFIRRPVIAIVVNLIIIIAGVQAIRTLNVRQYPRSENAAIIGDHRLRRAPTPTWSAASSPRRSSG